MRDLFKYQKQTSYPHMNTRDREIWDRFLSVYPDEYEFVQYDYHVGDPPPFNTLYDDDEDLNQDMLYRYRIDAIGFNDKGIDLIEIKPNAGASAIGQLKSYGILYKRDEEPKKPVNMVIVTDIERPNMAYLCKQEGIDLIIV